MTCEDCELDPCECEWSITTKGVLTGLAIRFLFEQVGANIEEIADVFGMKSDEVIALANIMSIVDENIREMEQNEDS